MCGGTDKFEQRSYLKYCNGAETFYSYDPQRRRLQNLVVNAKAGTIMDNAYSYDAMSNVLSVANNAPLPQGGKAGGQMSHQYTYDALYRLTRATGTYTGADSKTASYILAMGYDNMHRITSKAQHLTQQNVQFNGTLSAGYDLTYTYQDSTGHKFQLANVQDVNYRMEGTAGENDKVNNGHRYTYDANGNLVYINTSRVKKDGKEDEKATEQKFKWDEENRLLAADENGFVSNYWYDADGERTVKTSGEGEQIYVNSEFAGGRTNTAKFSLYVSPYLVASQGGRYTKHIYIGSQRIVSKLGDFASYGSDPRRIPYAGSEADAVTVDYKGKYSAQQQVIRDNYAMFNVPYNGEDNNDYVDGEGFCCNDGSLEAAQTRAMVMRSAKAKSVNGNFKPNDDYEKMQFYYHPDHLGSSSYITNLDGEVSQHIEYVPFGEVFIEERNNTWNTPYLFNAKEFDEETGMYYYGARYYEPRLSLWMSCDPMQEKYAYITSYCYTFDNPVKYIDPTGEDGEITGIGTEKDPFVIKANYYYEKGSLNEQQIKGLNNAISEYNNKGKLRKIKNDDGTKSYVRFNISAEEVEKGKFTTAIMNDIITSEGGQDIFFGNSLGTRANEGSNNTDLGSANGYRVDINQSSIDNFARNNHVDKDDLIKWTYVHEIGHNLGLDHSDKTDIMSQMNVIFHDGNILGGTTTSSPTITHPKVDTKGVKIMLDNRNKPRKGSLGIIRYR